MEFTSVWVKDNNILPSSFKTGTIIFEYNLGILYKNIYNINI